MALAPRVVQRRVAVAVPRRVIGAVEREVPSRLEPGVGGGEVQRGAPVVVRRRDVGAARHELAQARQVAVGGREPHADLVALAGEHGRAAAAGRGGVWLHGARARERREHVEGVARAQQLAEVLAAHGVAELVEARRERRDARDAGHDDAQHAAHAALGGDAHLEGVLAAVVVHAAAHHQAQRVAHGARLEDALARRGADAAVRQRRRHHRLALRVELEGAVHEVALQRLDQVGADRERALLLHHVAEAEVARRRGALAHVRAVLEGDGRRGVARELGPRVHHVVEAVVLAQLRLHERRRHDGAGVDVRVVRDAALAVVLLLEHALVEAPAGGLAPDVAVHGLLAVQLLRHAVRERLGGGLHAERRLAVAHAEALAVHRAHRHAPLLGVDDGERRDVVGVGAAVVGLGRLPHLLDGGAEAREVADDELAVEGAAHQQVLGQERLELLEVQRLVRAQRAERAREAAVALLQQPLLAQLRRHVRGRDLAQPLRVERVEERAVHGVLHELRVALGGVGGGALAAREVVAAVVVVLRDGATAGLRQRGQLLLVDPAATRRRAAGGGWWADIVSQARVRGWVGGDARGRLGGLGGGLRPALTLGAALRASPPAR